MANGIRRSTIFTLILCLGSLPVCAGPLDDYVKAYDPHFVWKHEESKDFDGYRVHQLSMTSLQWREANESKHPLWKHRISLIEPDDVQHRTALLWIEGGYRDKPSRSQVSDELVQMARMNHMAVAVVDLIPNQPLSFADETHSRHRESGRSEDALVAWTWDRYSREKDPTWLVQFPMTKASVRAMDVISAFAHQQQLSKGIDSFVLMGLSKRAHICWLAALVDSRVKAIVPIVYDILNYRKGLDHHYRSFEGWSPVVRDYVSMNITGRLDSSFFYELSQILDPFVHRRRLDLPKYLISSTGDDFFPCDSTRLFYSDLQGEKHLRYVPNTRHLLMGANYLTGVSKYLHALLYDEHVPNFKWKIDASGLLEIQSDDVVEDVKLWQAHNTNARDFRLTSIGQSWESSSLKADDDGRYRVQISDPSSGWSAQFLEVHLKDPSGIIHQYTTEIIVRPERYNGTRS